MRAAGGAGTFSSVTSGVEAIDAPSPPGLTALVAGTVGGPCPRLNGNQQKAHFLKRREWTRNHALGPHAYLAERCVPRAGNYLTLTFSKPSDDGGGIASYKVEVSLVEDFDFTKTPQVLRSTDLPWGGATLAALRPAVVAQDSLSGGRAGGSSGVAG